MTAMRRSSLLVRAGTAAALVLALAGCTPGGQFDPTSLFANDMFDTKTKLKGDREPVFPNGVPGTSSGVPPDLVKGYQPPPDQAADANAPDAAAEEAAKNKPKPKPKPKVARAPAQPPAAPPRRINVGPTPNQAAPAAPQGAAPAPQQSQQSPFPPPPQTAPAQQAAPTVESRWPDPPKPGTSSQ
jgi:outer membrane biosynthesis protein TonB